MLPPKRNRPYLFIYILTLTTGPTLVSPSADAERYEVVEGRIAYWDTGETNALQGFLETTPSESAASTPESEQRGQHHAELHEGQAHASQCGAQCGAEILEPGSRAVQMAGHGLILADGRRFLPSRRDWHQAVGVMTTTAVDTPTRPARPWMRCPDGRRKENFSGQPATTWRCPH